MSENPNKDTRFSILEAAFSVESGSNCSTDFMGPGGADDGSLFNQPRSNDNLSPASTNGDFSLPSNSSNITSKPTAAAVAVIPATLTSSTVTQSMPFEMDHQANQMFTDQGNSNSSFIRPADSNTTSEPMDEFEQRKRHRSAGPDLRNIDDTKPSYADLLAFTGTRERRPSGGPAVGVATHYPSQSNRLPDEPLPPVPPFTGSAHPFDAVASSSQNRVIQQSQFQQQQPSQQPPDPFQFSSGSFNGPTRGDNKHDQQQDSSESSSGDDSYEPDSSSSTVAVPEVGNLMHTLSYQRAFCSLPPGRGPADFAGLAMQLPIPAHHSLAAAAHMPHQRHFSGPAGIPMSNDSSQQQHSLMMVDQAQQPPQIGPNMGSYYASSQQSATAFLGSQIYDPQSQQQQQQQQQLVQHSNSATGGMNFLHPHDPRRLVAASTHSRHPSEPAPRPRRPSMGKASRITTGGDHPAGTSQQPVSVMVRDEQRKRQHNDIEKRRRSNINERIQQLATLLPNCQDPEFKQHKGNILTKVVDYIKQLQGLPEQVASLQMENSKLMSQNLQLQQRLATLTEVVRANGFQVANQVRFGDQNLIELATTGLANTAICHQASPNERSCSSQSLTPPGSRHPSGSTQLQVNTSSPIPSASNNRSQFSGDLMQMLCQQQQPH